MEVIKSVFDELSTVKCETEKKGKFTYISWAEAWKETKKLYPKANFKVYEKQNVKDGIIYNTGAFAFPVGKEPESGAFVKVSVTINDLEHIEIFPILNYSNKPIKTNMINAFDVNSSIKRGLTKALAMHGLGLYVYYGEDLPEQTEELKPTEAKK